MQWTKDTRGVIGYTAYDDPTGSPVKQIVDVDTSRTTEFANLPSGWSSTGTPLHLVTQMAVDGLGRRSPIRTGM